MKRKVFLAALMLCAALSVSGCGEKETDTDQGTQSQEDTNTEDEEEASQTEEESEEDQGIRIVSVDEVSKYVTVSEYMGMELDNTVAPVSDEKIQSRIESDLENNAILITDTNETVQNGDITNINYVGTIDGEAFDGGTADNCDLTIGSGLFIAGFEDGMIGMKKGETRKLNLQFPEGYPVESLAGQDVVFQVTLNSIKRAAELNDEWVKQNTDYQTVEEYQEGVAAELEEEARESMETNLLNTAFNSVIEGSEVKEYPEADMERVREEYNTGIENIAKQSNMTLEELLEYQGMSKDDFQSQCEQYAEFRVKQALVIQAIMDAEGLSFEDEACEPLKQKLADQYQAGNFEELVSLYGDQASYESLGILYVSQYIVEHAALTDDSALEDDMGDPEAETFPEEEKQEESGQEDSKEAALEEENQKE